MTRMLPVDDILPRLCTVLSAKRSAVISAAPGAGKTTRVPLALLDQSWLNGGKILMLEPRRLATRRAAEYMAGLLHERPGQTVGYRIRGESKVGKSTRIEVVTEGVLTRMLHDQPELPGVALVIFDEFHERSIHADLGLAFALDVQEHLRPDLRILIMSATLDHVAVADLLGGAEVVQSAGMAYPVETRYVKSSAEGPIEPAICAAIARALHETSGDLLVFLPGQREIRRVAERLAGSDLGPGVHVRLLFGEADPRQQQEALDPSREGTRKIILSTSIAETSLTIDGVRVVVDSGLSRLPRFDARRGMAGLVTVPESIASADQRRGRAGRQAPGVCYRMWSETQEASFPRYTMPEILSTDLMPLALDLALWGDPFGEHLRFLDRPPAGHIARARSVLTGLGALDGQGALTPHGKSIARLGVHPRIAHMILKGAELGSPLQACRLGAILSERDVLRGQTDRDVDLTVRWEAVNAGREVDRGIASRINAESERLLQMVGRREEKKAAADVGMFVALAYPDRIARRKESGAGFLLSNGTAATLPPRSNLSHEEFLAVAEVDGIGTSARILLAAPLDRKKLDDAYQDRYVWKEEPFWDEASESALVRRRLMLGELVLEEKRSAASGDDAREAILNAIRTRGLSVLPWSGEALSLEKRSEWLRTHGVVSDEWPRLDEDSLLASLEQWLSPFLGSVSKLSHLRRIDLPKILRSRFSHQQLRELDRLAPERIAIPTGTLAPIDYDTQNQPVLAVKLQEMFGQTSTPTVGNHIPLVIHLLSPAGRPLAVTQDLQSFWKNAYPEVRKQMRGRYPKHPWPEDPLQATPTKRTKKRTEKG